jgi:hypothetical protein
MKKAEREGGAPVARTTTRGRAPEPELDPEANPFGKELDRITLEPMATPLASSC